MKPTNITTDQPTSQARFCYTKGVRSLTSQSNLLTVLEAIAGGLQSNDFLQATAYDERLCFLSLWTLEAGPTSTATLYGRADRDASPFFRQEVSFTDSPPWDIEILARIEGERWVLQLPSEQ